MNKVFICGKIISIDVINDNSLNMVISVDRKIEEDKWNSELIDCEVVGNIVRLICDYCNVGNCVGLTGVLKVDYYNKDGIDIKNMKVLVDKLTLLKSV